MSATTRTCGNCQRPMGRGDIRQRDPRTGKVVCSLCLAHPATQPNKIDVTATREEHDRMDPRKPFPGLRALAHDGGDGQVVYHCFGGETRFLTPDGPVALRDAVGPVTVLTAPLGQTRGTWVDATVEAFGEQTLWEVVLRRNRRRKIIRATSGHRWFVRRPDRVVVTSDLRPGNRLAQVRLERVEASMNRDGVRAGVVFGDGAVHRRGERTYGMVSLWGGKTELVPYFEEVAGSAGYPVKTPGGVEGVRFTAGMKGYTKALPALDSDLSYLYGWLAGYFAADGTVSSNGQAVISSSVQEHLEHVRDVCTRLGIGTYEIRSSPRRGYGSEPTESYSVDLCTEDLSEDFFLRSAHASNFKSKPHERLGWTVESVQETTQVEEVYCAVVPGTESFALEDNILTGNCAFCGSGGVVARSDGSVECTVCQQYFTIQVQPRHPNSPQTVNGQPVHIPGMPEESEVTPATGGNNVPVPLDQQDKVVPGFSDAEMEEEIPGAQAFRTASGAVLDRTAYVQHLALGVTSDPARTLAQIRQANARPR